MHSDDYELLPHEELERLRKELEHIKKNPYSDAKQNKTLLESMEGLTVAIRKLTSILEEAQEDLIKEYAEASPTKLIKQVSMQNAKIAEGIVALSELVKQSSQRGNVQMQAQAPQQQQQPTQAAAPRRMPSPPRFPPEDPAENDLDADFANFNKK